ncbi:ORF6N domain-containing protein [Acidobacteria bacterium AH-259-D05]|nr:ORF6N domain-containing protein [Acidobacteria bacterium AH-259-D05]
MIPVESIQQRIYLIRRQKVMLDADLAELYGAETRILIRNVKRHIDRFPPHFMFQLTKEEFDNLKSHFATSNLRSQFGISRQWGGRRYPPYAFTEQGVAMLSSVLHSKRAIQVNIQIMDTFVRVRQLLATHKDLARKLEALEKKYDAKFRAVFDAIRKLMEPEMPPPQRQIGFEVKKE